MKVKYFAPHSNKYRTFFVPKEKKTNSKNAQNLKLNAERDFTDKFFKESIIVLFFDQNRNFDSIEVKFTV